MRHLLQRRTADFYILKTFLGAFLFIITLFAVLAFVLVLFDELDVMTSNDVSFGLGLTYVFLRIPHELVKAIPIIVVLSMVVTISNLLRHNEMLMLYIAGYTPMRLILPLASFMIVLLALVFWLNENLCAPFAAQANSLLETRIKKTTRGLSGTSGIWIFGDQNQVIRAGTFYPYANRIDSLSIFIFQGDNRTLSERIEAEQAHWNVEQNRWILKKVQHYRIPRVGTLSVENHDSLSFALNRSPDDFGTVTQHIEQMSHGDLKRLVDSIRQSGENPWMYLPDLRIKEAFPFAVFFLGILTYVLMLYLGSTKKTSGIGLGLLAVIIYFMVLSLGKSFAQAGAIPPWFGAWAPNILCFTLTLFFLNRLRNAV